MSFHVLFISFEIHFFQPNEWRYQHHNKEPTIEIKSTKNIFHYFLANLKWPDNDTPLEKISHTPKSP